GASSRQVRHMVQVASTYQAPGTFKGCLLFLSAMACVVLNQNAARNPFACEHHRGLGIALGSTSGSAGESIGSGEGVGVANGVRTSPFFVVKTPPDIVTSSTK